MSNARDKANIPALNFSSTGIDDNATSTAITIDSNERVGIGESSPISELHITDASATAVVRLESSDSGDCRINFDDQSATDRGRIIYAHSDDSLRTEVAGSERMRIDSSGNVGIGTSSPESPLHVVGTNTLLSPLRIQPASGNGASAFSIRQDATADRFNIGLAYSSASGIIGNRVKPSNTSESDATGFLSSSASNVARTAIKFHTSGDIQFYNAPQQNTAVDSVVAMTERMRIDSSGRLLIGTTDIGYTGFGDDLTIGSASGNNGMTIRSGTSNYGTFYFSDATGTSAGTYAGKIQYNHSDNSMVFATNSSSERMRINSSGNVGIGTSSPNAELHISKSADANSTELILENTFTASGSTDEIIQLQARFGGYDASYIITGKEEDFTTSANRSSFMSFTTRKDGTLAEKMRIDSSGNVGIGTSSPTQKLDVSGTVKATAFQGDGSALTNLPGGGKVLQVVSTTKTDTFSAGNVSTYADITGLSASITPSATSSKILCIVNINSSSDQNTNANFFRLVRGSTAINVGTSVGSRVAASAHMISRDTQRQTLSSFNFLDSPSTTSATTYKIQYQNGGAGGGNCRINRSYNDANNNDSARTASTITLMEIGV